jgi:hypothetical protein
MPFIDPRAIKVPSLGTLPDNVTIDLSHLGEVYSFRHQAADPGDAKRFGRLAKAA